MRFTIAYYFLLLYSMLVFQPLLLIAEDRLSHTFTDAIHIATMHAKYGNNHLDLQLPSTGTDNDSKNHSSVNSEEQVPVHFSESEYKCKFPPKNYRNNYNLFAWFKLPFIFILYQAPPPRFSLHGLKFFEK